MPNPYIDLYKKKQGQVQKPQQTQKTQEQSGSSGNPYIDLYGQTQPQQQKTQPAQQKTQPLNAADALADVAGRLTKAAADKKGTDLNKQRSSLMNQLQTVQDSAAYITDPDAANANKAEERSIINQLNVLDKAQGNADRYYSNADRVKGSLAAAANEAGATYANALGTVSQLAGAQDETGRAIADSAYAGYATDPVSIENMRKSVEQNGAPESLGILDTNQKITDASFSAADRLDERDKAYTARAKEGADALDRFGVDLTKGAFHLATDAAVRSIPVVGPAIGMLPMVTRAFGGAAMEARHNGADEGQQLLYGIKDAGIEYFTEKMAGLGSLRGEKGFLDNLVKDGIDRFVARGGDRFVGDLIAGFGSESAEEMVSYALNHIADKLLRLSNDGFKFTERDFDVGDMLYEGLLGGVLGLFGSAVKNPENATKAEFKRIIKQSTEDAARQRLGALIESRLQEEDNSSFIADMLGNKEARAAFEQMYGGKLTGSAGQQIKTVQQFAETLKNQQGAGAASTAQAQQHETEEKSGSMFVTTPKQASPADTAPAQKPEMKAAKTPAQRRVEAIINAASTQDQLVQSLQFFQSKPELDAAFEELTGSDIDAFLTEAAQNAAEGVLPQGDNPAPAAPENAQQQAPVELNSQEQATGAATPTGERAAEEQRGAASAPIASQDAVLPPDGETPIGLRPLPPEGEAGVEPAAKKTTATEATRKLQEKYGDGLRTQETRGKIQGLARQARETDFSDQAQVRSLWESAKQQAREILRTTENPSARTGGDTGGEIRSYLRGQKIRIDERLRSDRPSEYESLTDLRRRSFGTLNFSNTEGMTLDQVYQELGSMFGEGMFPQDAMSHSEIVERILNAVANEKGQGYTYEQSLSDAEYERAAAELTMDLMRAAEGVTGQQIPTPVRETQQNMTAEQDREAAIQSELDSDFEGMLTREDAERIVDERYEAYGEYDLDKILNGLEDSYGEAGEDADEFDEYAYYAERYRAADAENADEAADAGGTEELPETVGQGTPERGLAANEPAGVGEVRGPRSLAPENGGVSGEAGTRRPYERAGSRGGAASGTYEELGERYGTIEAGENPARESAVPKQIDERRKVGEAVRTLYEASATPEERLADIRNAVVDGKLSHISVSNESLAKEAESRIRKDGWEASLRDFLADVRSGKTGDRLTALGAVLYNNAANSGMDGKSLVDLAVAYNDLMHNMGRGLAAGRILKTLTPEAKLYAIQKTVSRMNEEAAEKRAKKEAKDKNIHIDEKLADEFLKAETDEERDKALDRIKQNIADQIPSTIRDKWNALRYLNMLGNFKTQIRNLTGNATMLTTASLIKNHMIRGSIEGVAHALSGGRFEKNTSVLYNPKLAAEAWADFKNVEKEALGERKYSDAGRQVENDIQEKRRIFKFEPLKPVANLIGKAAPGAKGVADKVSKAASLEGYRKATNWTMEMGDQIFSRTAYADAMAGWMQAHKVKHISDMTPEMLDRARAFAIKEAQEATFRDSNGFSDWASRLGRSGNEKGFGKFIGLVGEGIMPFRKTPANVLMRAYEYSPLGVINTIAQSVQAVNGDATGSDVVNALSKTFTGTGLAFVGYLLARAGKLRTRDDDDKLEQFHKDQGAQDYALDIGGGNNITLDWQAPASIPLFMGAELEKIVRQGGISGDDALEILSQLTEPMLEMSMLSGLNDALELSNSYDNTIGALPNLILNSVLGYATQGLNNSLIRQAEQASEKVRRTSYTDPNSPLPSSVQRKISQFFGGIPGKDVQQQDYIDVWGRNQEQGSTGERVLQSFLNPAYVGRGRSTKYDGELERLYNAGYKSALPQKPARSTEVNGERLTPEEYQTYAEKAGRKKLELIGDFLDSEEYKKLSDEDREAVISNLYSYANHLAAKDIVKMRGEKMKESSHVKSMEKLRELDKNGGSAVDYLLSKTALASSTENKDYKAVDALLGDIDKMDKATQEQLFADVNRLADRVEAHKAGIDTVLWEAAYAQKQKLEKDKNTTAVQDVISMTQYLDSQKGLNRKQKDLLREQMGFYTTFRADAEKFDQLTGAGLSSDKAGKVWNAINSLQPLDGHAGVTQNQRIRAISSMGNLSDAEKWAVLEFYSSDSCYEKAMQAKAKGKSFEQWVKEYTKGK